MSRLTFESFFSIDTDAELNQLNVLAGLKDYSSDFRKKLLYPALAEIINLHNMLEAVSKQRNNISNNLPRKINGFDVPNRKIIYEEINIPESNIDSLFELIDWAIPLIQKTIEEGIALYEFVEENMELSHVGVIPLYRDEGYLIIPDNIESRHQIHRFECSLFSSGKEPYRSLKTVFVKTIEKEVLEHSPQNIKMELIQNFSDLPNPATFICETDLDFPFSETVFPVAKRKLMAKIAA